MSDDASEQYIDSIANTLFLNYHAHPIILPSVRDNLFSSPDFLTRLVFEECGFYVGDQATGARAEKSVMTSTTAGRLLASACCTAGAIS